MSKNTIYLDRFSGSVSELKPKQKRDPIAVLFALQKDPNVSTWDMGSNGLWKTIDYLKSHGFIVSIDKPYPWLYFEVTESGLKELGLFDEEK